MLKNNKNFAILRNNRKSISVLKLKIEYIPLKGNKRCNSNVGSALRVSGGNPVDGLPPARHTETIAKLARLGPAKNGTALINFIELSML